MADIKLLVCCHQKSAVPQHPLLMPVQVGAALAQAHFPGFAHDDDGENISGKNRSYCELTALYWAWKNLDADYYGLFHYRRYLYPDPAAKRPYRVEAAPTEALLETLGYAGFAGEITRYDIVLPKAEEMYVSVRDHYAAAPFHHEKDLRLVEEIVRELYPEYAAAMDTYFSGTAHYFGNICVMSRQEFHRYCSWLFPILEEFDRRADISGYGPKEQRVDGYLAERLLGIYVTRGKRELQVLELPRVHFVPDDVPRRKKQLLNILLPPGSKRRARFKHIHMRITK